jgi:signal transduction histidine kinase
MLPQFHNRVIFAFMRLRLLDETRRQAEQVQQIIGTVPEGMILLDADSRILVVNPAAQKCLDALTDARWGEVLTHLGGRPVEELLAPTSRPGLWHEVTPDGDSPEAFEVVARPMKSGTETAGWVLVLRDVTEERRVQREMWRQERLAAIGQLAGGVAHDFNNMLTAIQGYTELVLGSLASDDPQTWPSGQAMRADLEQVAKAGQRAAGLTRQLLAFSRKQVLQPQILDLNTLVTDFEKMLRRIISEDVELITALSPSLARVMADPGQIEQVILNLAVNARDAMPDGGHLTVETANVVLDENYAQTHLEVQPGHHVMLAISDTGIGMTEEVKSQIFEPFFTTKEEGKGTGLGLATVYGIVKQSEGNIEVYSEPGVGTTFKIYLPRVEETPEQVAREGEPRALPRGVETILLVEDEDAVRELARQALEQSGYTVLHARQPDEALFLCERYTGPIDLLLTDLVMPGMSGHDLAERLVPMRPEMKILYVSGYTDNAIVHHGVLDEETAFLQKPFTPAVLARRVREVLGAPP